MSKGRGGKPPKLVLTRVEVGWSAEPMQNPPFEPFTAERLKDIIEAEVSPDVWALAENVYKAYRSRLLMFENPMATTDHKKGDRALGYFKQNLIDNIKSFQAKLDKCLDSEMSHDLAALVREQLIPPSFFNHSDGTKHPNPGNDRAPDLRSHLNAAFETLSTLETLLERVEIKGEILPWTNAEVRVQFGQALKEIAENHALPARKMVVAFAIHEAQSDEAFAQWFQRLE
jgi:hypothetical protein